MANVARKVELLTQYQGLHPRPVENIDTRDVLANIETQMQNEQKSVSCSAEEDAAVRDLRKELFKTLNNSDLLQQDEIAAAEFQQKLSSDTPDEQVATTALIAETQEIVSGLIANVTEGLKQSVEGGAAAEVLPEPQLQPPGYAKRCLLKIGTAAKKTAAATFSVVWYFLTKIYDFIKWIIGSPQFKLFLASGWRILRQHFCQFLAIKYGYDLKNYFARKMNPRTFYEGFLSKAISQYFESSYFNNIFDTIATTIPELIQKIFGEIATTTVTVLHGGLTFLKKLGVVADIVGKVMTFLINLFIMALKTAMQLAFPKVIASWADSDNFDLIVHSVFFAGCYGEIFAKGGAALVGAGAAYKAQQKKSSPEKKKSPKGGGGRKPKDDDDEDSDDDDSDKPPGDLKIQEPQSRGMGAAPTFPFSKTSTFPPGGPTEGVVPGFQFEPPETKSGIPPPPFFAPRVPAAAPEDLPQPQPPTETLIEKIGKGLNAWNIFTTVATVLQYKTQETMRKPKG